MTPDEFMSILDNPNLISGIYNYCDRWCERCPMTSRCSVFMTTPQLDPEDFADDKAFMEATFNSLKESFQLSMQLIERSARANGLDISEIEKDDTWAKEEKAKNEKARNTPLSKLAMEYVQLASNWLKNCDDSMHFLDENLESAAMMGLPDRDPEQEAKSFKDALDVISYYMSQIFVKLVRAQTDRKVEDTWCEENDFPKDSDGSAKVALIGIDKSTIAWSTFLPHLPQDEDSILEILSRLQQLRTLTESTFPDARTFKRTGFDD